MNKNKKGKKNLKKIIILSALLSLLSLIGITGTTTYAKYISNKTIPSQTATVAKWGYKVTADATKLFGENHGALASETTVNDSGTLVVSSTAGSNVIAPGTAGYLTLKLEGSSEVMAKLTFSSSSIPEEIYLQDGNGAKYYPVNWTLQYRDSAAGTFLPVEADGTTIENTRLDEVITTLEGLSHDLPVQTTPYYHEYRIVYSWAFDGVADSGLKTSDGTVVTGDEADTMLGLYSADQTMDLGTFAAVISTNFAVGITVSQVQQFN